MKGGGGALSYLHSRTIHFYRSLLSHRHYFHQAIHNVPHGGIHTDNTPEQSLPSTMF